MQVALSHATVMHGHLNTDQVWMGRRECAAQQQGDKKSILMNFPTRQCLRKRKRDKTEPSFQEHRVSVQKNKGTGVLLKTRNRGGISSHLLGLQPRAFAQVCKPQITHYLCLQMFLCNSSQQTSTRQSPSRVLKTRSTSRHAPRFLLLHIQ